MTCRCVELSIDETGLTKRRGAEILENEFEEEWQKHGGAALLKKNANKNIIEISSKEARHTQMMKYFIFLSVSLTFTILSWTLLIFKLLSA